MDLLNILIALVSIGFGLVGWVAPRYTMDTVGLRQGDGTMGLSEVRAASGALFVGLGVGAFLLGTPGAYAMIGFAWGGAAIGRATSLLLDGRSTKKWTFFGVEAAIAVLAVAINV